MHHLFVSSTILYASGHLNLIDDSNSSSPQGHCSAMSYFNVSVVLNMHREAPYLRATLLSLNACAQEARAAGLRCELVAVFDRADELTKCVFNESIMSGFHACVAIDVDVGSLGLARNAGIGRARGEFIWTADADDLVSRNSIVHLYRTAKSIGDVKCAVFMNYLVGFGEKFLVGKYYDDSYLTVADFVWHHPYISRIFLRRSVFEKHAFLDLRVSSGFAYEDWDFLVRLRQDGFRMHIAPDTVFFYRQRKGSLLRQADSVSSQMIPQSSFLDPAWFIRELEREKSEIGDWTVFVEKRRATNLVNYAEELMSSPTLRDALIDANRLDPEVEPARIAASPSYSPVPWHDDHLGFRLAEAYRIIGPEKFTDLVILPSLNPGELQDYLLEILNQITECTPDVKILIICTESARRHEWMARLPHQAIMLDIYNAFPTLSNSDRDRLLVRLLLAASDTSSRLHMGASKSSLRLIDGYGTILFGSLRAYFYRVNSETSEWNGEQVENPLAIYILRRYGNRFEKILGLSAAAVALDVDRIGASRAQYCILGPRPSEYSAQHPVPAGDFSKNLIEIFGLGMKSSVKQD